MYKVMDVGYKIKTFVHATMAVRKCAKLSNHAVENNQCVTKVILNPSYYITVKSK